MNIRGLSNQWKTRDRLFDSFTIGIRPDSPRALHEKCSAIQRLMERLEAIPAPDVWAGTAHGEVNLCSRDIIVNNERVPYLVAFEAAITSEAPPTIHFRVRCREVIKQRPTMNWVEHVAENDEAAIRLILEALSYTGVPVKRCKN